MTVRTRFAPSPTGYMHIGGMRTALFNWLWARHNGGVFVLRIDDTDRQRNIDEALGPILNAFRWLGLNWDEGPEVGGEHGPYFQSQRNGLYLAACDRLLSSGKAFRDFDTPQVVQDDRKVAEHEKRPYLNIRRSLDLSPTEIEDRLAAATPHVVRFLVPRDRGEKVAIDDAVRGRVEWDAALLADPVIMRSDGSPLYNFATVVDDGSMAISHVIRAEEHLSNTPVQVLMHEALGYELPTFAHIPFVTSPGSTKKLSKRDLAKYRSQPQFKKMFEKADAVFPRLGLGSSESLNPVMVEYYEKIGYLPQAVLNALSRLGWSLDDKTEVMSLDTVVEHFTLDRVVKNAAGLDPDKLFSFQSHWMNEVPHEEKVVRCGDYLRQAGLVHDPLEPAVRERIGAVVTALGDRLKLFSDILDADYFFKDEIEYDEKNFAKRVAKDGVPELLAEFTCDRLEPLADSEWTAEWLENELNSFSEAKGVSTGMLIHALRLSTTGQAVGPGVYDCLVLVGREKSLKRIEAALERARA
ncbi:MAG: glutamate--tRNA ligase [Planctomycetaceae bacterium]